MTDMYSIEKESEARVNVIDKFDGEYQFLSNFYDCEVPYKGLVYRNSESAFQAQKCTLEEDKIPFTNVYAGTAKKMGRKVNLRNDWEKVKLSEMKNIVRSKFTNNEDLRNKLVSTGNAQLIEGNYWHDTFWGVCNGKGENHLGKILMEIREELS